MMEKPLRPHITKEIPDWLSLVLPAISDTVDENRRSVFTSCYSYIDLASDLAQLQSIDGHTGFTAEIGDVSGFAGAIQTLIDEPELRREFGRRGRALVEEQYTWASTVEKTTEHLLRIVDRC